MSIKLKRIYEAIQDEGRLSEKLSSLLNKQIQNELQSSQIYRGMSCWLDSAKWIGASNYYFKSSQEELTHMEKIYKFLFDRNVVAKVPICEEVKQKFEDVREIVEESLKHEIEVTKEWDDISNAAKDEGDNTTYEFAQWFLKEQIEEEDRFRNILFKLDLEMPKWKIDEMFTELTK